MGIAAILAAVAGAAQLLLDGNPNTNPDWPSTFAAIMAGVGLMTARDNLVTSEASGATKKEMTKMLAKKDVTP